MNEISASVVLYKTPKMQLERLLDCLRASSLAIHLYVIDNSPSLEGAGLSHLPWVTYLKTGKNEGYGAGHNIALRRILRTSRYHVVLNPDVYFEPRELKKMLRFMDANVDVGQLMPRVVYPNGELQYLCKLLPAPSDLLCRRFSFGPLRDVTRRSMSRFELRFTGYDREMNIPYLSGCFMLFRTSALQRVGLFDERFFMYPEDIDITRRMHVEFRTMFYPGATIIHDHARESYKTWRATWVHMLNMARYFNKWGWFWDHGRSRINRKTLQQFNEYKSKSLQNKLARIDTRVEELLDEERFSSI